VTRILVTGAGGFVGRALCAALTRAGAEVRAALRRPGPVAGEPVVVGEVGPDTDWIEALRGIEAVVHLAARVHMLRETTTDALSEFRRVNVAGSERLGRQCARAGVRRLVYVSSVKVHGESTDRCPFTEGDPPAPQDAYAVSKLEAEHRLASVSSETGLEVATVRPCLVYGPGVGGNIARLLRLIDLGIPLPLGSVTNRRSLLGVDNLCDLLARCIEHASAAGAVFLASDGEDLSTRRLIEALAAGLGRPPRLVPVPPSWLRAAAALGGARDAYQRVCGSLQADSGKARRVLEWVPPVSADDGLRKTGAWYRGRPR
jgi:nucleoside-diphosphate-sugar epimerase